MAWMSALILLSCWSRGGPNPLELALEESQALFAQRHQIGPSAALEALEGLSPEQADSPAVIAQTMQIQLTEASQAPESARLNHYRALRERGWSCLEHNLGWSSRVALRGGQINRQAAEALTPADSPCLSLLLQAWVRWIELRGPTGHLDLATVEILAIRLMTLDEEDWVGPWARAMAQSLPAQASEERRAVAEQFFMASLALAPERAEIRVDRYLRLLAGGPEERRQQELHTLLAAYSLTDEEPWVLENRAALARLRGEGD